MITVYYVQAKEKLTGLVPLGYVYKYHDVAKFFHEKDAIAHAANVLESRIEARPESEDTQHEAHKATAGSASAWGQPLATKPGLVRA